MRVGVRKRACKGGTAAHSYYPKLRTGSLCAFLACTGVALSLSACSFSAPKSSAKPAQAPAIAAATPSGPSAMDTFRALAPPEGMKYTQLFAEPVSDPNARMQRLEDS